MINLEKTGKRISSLRRERGYTGEALAERLQVSPQAVLVLTETLFPHLWEVQQVCVKRMELLMEELLVNNPAPDKAMQQLAWVAHMNSLKAQVEDSVLRELIYEEDIV